jgi:hypothetical protein
MLATPLPPGRLPISKNHDPFKMAGVDMRSDQGRRFRDIAALVIAEHGPDLDATRVRELAGIRLAIEVATAAAIGGDAKARQDIVRLSNLAARKERELREAKRVAADSKPAVNLEQHLARRSAEKAAAG